MLLLLRQPYNTWWIRFLPDDSESVFKASGVEGAQSGQILFRSPSHAAMLTACNSFIFRMLSLYRTVLVSKPQVYSWLLVLFSLLWIYAPAPVSRLKTLLDKWMFQCKRHLLSILTDDGILTLRVSWCVKDRRRTVFKRAYMHNDFFLHLLMLFILFYNLYIYFYFNIYFLFPILRNLLGNHLFNYVQLR